ncbi:hypothetical protein [Streptomyces sp. NPDC049916]|uniref:TY-Chap domain-containing protein n=1 Tax=Streptomyces sp. NPDC049916 TaxID=3155156 RepID=UPI003441D902
MENRTENAIPWGDWLGADDFRLFVRETAPLHPRSWSLPDFEDSTSALGWELREPRQVGKQVWRRFAARKGPRAGYGTVIGDASDPGRVRRLNVRLIDLPEEDSAVAVGCARAAWRIMEEEVGAPAMWGHDRGPWMLWRRPGTGLLVHAHDDGQLSLDLLPPDADADAAGLGHARGRWRAAPSPATPSPAAGSGAASPSRVARDGSGAADPSGITWDGVEKRLAETLRSLVHGAPYLPARFIGRLGAASDPRRFVQFWNQDGGLVVEASGHLHRPEAADPARLTGNGWEFSRQIWQRRFPADTQGHAIAATTATAARMLVEEVRRLDVEPADLSYDGTMTGRGHRFLLDLPDLGPARVQHPVT